MPAITQMLRRIVRPFLSNVHLILLPVRIVVGCSTAIHKDVQVGTYNLLLPIQPSHGTVWLEDDTGRVARKVRARQSRNGSLQQLYCPTV